MYWFLESTALSLPRNYSAPIVSFVAQPSWRRKKRKPSKLQGTLRDSEVSRQKMNMFILWMMYHVDNRYIDTYGDGDGERERERDIHNP